MLRRSVCIPLFNMLVGIALSACAGAQAIHGRDGITLPPPPAVEAIPVTDAYFGTKILDSYRWLENAKSPQTRAFIDAQNAYTARYLKQARIRPEFADSLEALERVSHWSIPVERGGILFFEKRLSDEEQSSIYIRRGSAPSKAAGQTPAAALKDERLVDPAKLSRDSNTSVSIEDISRDGRLLAYSVREGGADETSVHLIEVKTGKALEDELPSARYEGVSFAADGASFYYTRADKSGSLLYQHRLGTRPSHDLLIFGREFHAELLGANDLLESWVTDDGRYLVVQIERGVPARRVDIVFRDLRKPNAPFEILVWGMEARFSAAWAQGAWYVKTDYQAPLGRILRADPGILPDVWKTIVPESTEAIDGWSIVGGKLFVDRLKDVQTQTSIYSLDGRAAGTVDFDGIGTASGIEGRTTDRYGYFSFQSFLVPPTIYRLDTVSGKRAIFAQSKIAFEAGDYELQQFFFPSKDGTKVPIFIVGKKGLKRDGTERLLMTGYGGFNLSMMPVWNPLDAAWLEAGGWFAVPGLRGGGEYGESWHQQGMFEKKQNVFDDWFAAAEYLIANKYTSASHFAISGRSNGGLLMGASITERPELFAAVWCGYPLLDMLRFQRFLVGSYWITEYGSAEKEKQFPYLLRYSPYQNVKAGVTYPAVMFFTGDGDTRVDPLHARKMTALLQSATVGGRPVLLHYSLAGGHSAGISVTQQMDDYADQLSFLWTETGQTSATR